MKSRKNKSQTSKLCFELPPIVPNPPPREPVQTSGKAKLPDGFVYLSDLLDGTYLRQKSEERARKLERKKLAEKRRRREAQRKLEEEAKKLIRLQAPLPINPDDQIATILSQRKALGCICNNRKLIIYKPRKNIRTYPIQLKTIRKLKPSVALLEEAKKEYWNRGENEDHEVLDCYCCENGIPWYPTVIRSPIPWHTTFAFTRNRMIFMYTHAHPIILKLTTITQNLFSGWVVCKEEDVGIGRGDGLPLKCDEIQTRIEEACTRTKNFLINKWLPKIADALVEFTNLWEKQSSYMLDHFFSTIHSLMSSQLRLFITKNLEYFKQYFQIYENGNDFYIFKDFELIQRPLLCVEVKVKTNVSENETDIHNLLEFEPSIEEIRKMIYIWCVDIIKTNFFVPRIDCLLFPEYEQEIMNLFSVKEDEEYIQQIINAIIFCFDANCIGPRKYLSCYEKFISLMNGSSVSILKNMLNIENTHNLEDFNELIKQYDKICNEIQVMRRYVYLNLILLDCGHLNRFLEKTVLDLKQNVINFFMENNRRQNKEICNIYQTISQRSSEMPETTAQLVQLLQYIKHSRDVTMLELRMRTDISSKWLLFLMEYANFTDEDIILNTRVFVWPNDIQVIMETSLKTLLGKKYMAEEALKLHKSLFEDKLKRHERLFDAFRRLDPPIINIENISENVKRVDDIFDKLTEDKKEAININEDETLLDQNVSAFILLTSMLTSIEPFYKLWHVCFDFYTGYDKWYFGPFMVLNAQEISDKVDEQEALLEILSKNLSEWPGARRVADMVQARVTKFKTLVPLLKAICNEGLRERHWEKASEYLDKPLEVHKETTLAEMVELGMEKFIPMLQNISVSATKELALETTLNIMKSDWEDVSFQCVLYRETGVPILKSVDDIQLMLDDHILKSQTMRGSPYIKPFQQEMQEWEEKLISMQDIIDDWLQVQNSWMYLEAIFCSEDIMRQMPAESRSFREVDRAWKVIMTVTAEQPKVLQATAQPSLLQQLRQCNSHLTNIQRSLNNYLEKKRLVFTRFFFISNDELLEILSETKDPKRVQPHIKKCFDGIHSLKFNDEEDIEGMVSDCGECVNFTNNITPSDAKGMVEKWLCLLEEQMKISLRDSCQSSLAAFDENKLKEFTESWQSQIVQVAYNILTTNHITEAFKANSLEKHLNVYTERLIKLTDLLKYPVDTKIKLTLEAMIIINTRYVDMLNELIESNIQSIDDYAWISQIRYYWRENTIIFSLMFTDLLYGFEYLGNYKTLVQTMTMKKCFRFFSCALKFNKYCTLQGASSTGKTDTIKEFMKLLAKKFVIFSCFEGINCKSLDRFLKGTVQSGSWLCLDGFNNIKIEVLSVLSQQLYTIHKSLINQSKVVSFDGNELTINRNCAIFLTISKRVEEFNILPDNLRSLMKISSMGKPDYRMIGRVVLQCNGFVQSEIFGNKIAHILDSCEQCMSDETHYDFGIRQLKIILNVAAKLKIENPTEMEENIILNSITSVIQPKLLAQDIRILDKICSIVFSKSDTTHSISTKTKQLIEKINSDFEKKNLQHVPYMQEKILKIFEMIDFQKGLILIGKTMSGKSTAYKCVASVLSIQCSVVNPKSVTLSQLYGYFHKKTNEWCDGIISSLFRDISSSGNVETVSATSSKKWIIFDGPFDSEWSEFLHSALDDNKKICLISGETIKLSGEFNVIFEIDKMDRASPAIVSRCAVIHIEQSSLGWKTIYKSFITEISATLSKNVIEIMSNFIEWITPLVLTYITNECILYVQTGEVHLFQSFCRILQSVIGKHDEPENILWIYACCLFSITWGLGSTILECSRKKFEAYLRQLIKEAEGNNLLKMDDTIRIPENSSIFDYRLAMSENERKDNCLWTKWKYEDSIPQKVDGVKAEIIWTEQSYRASWLLNNLITNIERNSHEQFGMMLCGEATCGKTIISSQTLYTKLSSQKFIVNHLIFNSCTTPQQLQDTVMSKLDRRRKGVFGPAMGKQCIVFVDNVNYPEKDTSGSQGPLEMLRQWLQHNHWYDHSDQTKLYLVDLQLVGTMSKAKNLSSRFLSHLHVIPMDSISYKETTDIFIQTLQNHFQQGSYAVEVKKLAKLIVESSMELLKFVMSTFTRNQKSSHYLWNICDVKNIINGIIRIPNTALAQADKLVALWNHEAQRVFHDRLITTEEQDLFLQRLLNSNSSFNIPLQIICNSDSDAISYKDLSTIFFGSYMEPDVYPKIYDRVSSLEEMEEKFKYYIKSNKTEAAQRLNENFVIFPYVLDHVSRACRALSQKNGHLLSLGISGLGKQSILHLASLALQIKLSAEYTKKKFVHEEWLEYLRNVTLAAGIDDEMLIILLPMETLKNYQTLNDALLLASLGEIPNLYKPEHKTKIVDKMLLVAREMGYVETTPTVLMNIFVERIKKNLKIAVTLSPTTNNFTKYSSMFPVLSSYFVFDWYSMWPNEAIQTIAKVYLNEIQEMDGHNGNLTCNDVKICKLAEACLNFHNYSKEMAKQFYQDEGFKVYISSTTYLELFRVFKKSYVDRVKVIKESQRRYLGGLKQLSDAADQVILMQQQLTTLQPQLLETSTTTEQLMIKIEQDTVMVEAQKEIVAADEALSNEAAATAQAIKDDCEGDLAEAVPALEAAITALNTLRPADITLVKSMKNPPAGVKLVMEAVCVMKNIKTERKMNQEGLIIDDYWGPSLKMLGDLKFLDSLKLYDKDNINPTIMKRIRERYIPDREFQPDVITKVSAACEGLCRWVRAMEVYDRVVKVVTPKKAALATAEKELYIQMSMLNEKRAHLQNVLDKLQTLNDEFAEYTRQKKQLEDQIFECRTKLARAEKLISGLGGETQRWNDIVMNLHSQLENALGDILLSSFIISHLGAFTLNYRADILKYWCNYCVDKGINITENFDIITILSDIDQLRLWKMAGLPNDTFSLQNAIIIQSCYLYPMIIDPQELARNWIMKIEKKNNIIFTKTSENKFGSDVLRALSEGFPIMIVCSKKNKTCDLDHLLNMKIFEETVINWKGHDINVKSSFRIYLVTDNEHVEYSPEFNMKVTLVNFSISKEGLEERILSSIVKYDQEDLELRRSSLLVECADRKVALKQTEDHILSVLSGASNILEDEDANNTLMSNKYLSEKILTEQDDAVVAQRVVEESRNEYLPLAKQIAALFTYIYNLKHLNPIYEYSFDWFLTLFEKTINEDKNDKNIIEKWQKVLESFQLILFKNISCGLFENDRTIFSLQMLIFKLKNEALFKDELLKIIINGSSNVNNDSHNPFKNWLCDSSWKALSEVVEILKLQNFEENFKVHENDWKIIYESNYPEHYNLPPPYDENKGLLKFFILRCLRPLRIKQYIEQFVREELGEEFTKIGRDSVKQFLFECDKNSPLILLLSKTCDPTESLTISIKLKDSNLVLKSLGDDNSLTDNVESSLLRCAEKGERLLLQNLHLSSDKILEQLYDCIPDAIKISSEGFHLTLTTLSTHRIPEAILRKSIKAVVEKEYGMKNKLFKILKDVRIDNEQMENVKNENMHRLLFLLYVFHAYLLERTQFGQYGFNLPYFFDDESLQFSLLQTLMIAKHNDQFDFPAFYDSIGDCNYSSFSNSYVNDATIFNTVIRELFNEKVIKNHEKYKIYDIEECVIAEAKQFKALFESQIELDDLALYVENIHSLEEYSLNKCALYYKDKRSNEMITAALQKYFRCNRLNQRKLFDTNSYIENILHTLPEELEIIKHYQSISADSYMKIVLCQELRTYKKLLQIIRTSLNNLLLGLKGKASFDEELNEFLINIENFQTPKSWKFFSQPSLKKLPEFIDNFIQRYNSLIEWSKNGYSNIVSISAFFHPKRVLYNFLMSEVSRNNASAENYDLFYTLSRSEIAENDHYIGLKGLFLDGADFDEENGILKDKQGDISSKELPVIYVLVKKKPIQYANAIVECSWYFTSMRSHNEEVDGCKIQNFIGTIPLPITEGSSKKWILKNVAILMEPTNY